MLREWEEPRVGGASRRERELRKDAKHPSRSRREAPPTRPRGDAPEGRFGGYPRYGLGRDRRSWGDSRARFGLRPSDGSESASWRSVAVRGGHVSSRLWNRRFRGSFVIPIEPRLSALDWDLPGDVPRRELFHVG